MVNKLIISPPLWYLKSHSEKKRQCLVCHSYDARFLDWGSARGHQWIPERSCLKKISIADIVIFMQGSLRPENYFKDSFWVRRLTKVDIMHLCSIWFVSVTSLLLFVTIRKSFVSIICYIHLMKIQVDNYLLHLFALR